MSQWRPIESAPKDGRTVFIWYAGECVHAAYLADHHGRIPNWYLLDKWRNWGPVSDFPKWWMPLPDDPNSSTEVLADWTFRQYHYRALDKGENCWIVQREIATQDDFPSWQVEKIL